MNRPKYKQLYLATVENQRKQDAKIHKLQAKLDDITSVLLPYGKEWLLKQSGDKPIYCRPLEYLAATAFIDADARFGSEDEGFKCYSWRDQPIYKVTPSRCLVGPCTSDGNTTLCKCCG